VRRSPGRAEGRGFGLERAIVVLLHLWSFAPADRQRMTELPPMTQSHHPDSGWLEFIQGRNAGYPAAALQTVLETVRRALAPPAMPA
jgi:hypothetical protein